MGKEESNCLISLKKYINEEDAGKINELQSLCYSNDNVNLKLEVDFKLFVRKNEKSLNQINEFFYYIDDALVGYLGICSFGEGVAEINGMVHPEYRRRGIFKRLYGLAIDECKKRNFDKVLLLSDDRSSSGIAFIELTGAEYAFSECRMSLSEESMGEGCKNITLRRALNSDTREINRQSSIYFGVESSNDEEVEVDDRITYMIELKGKGIGKIKVSMDKESAFISGFGILPEFRGKGFGREALSATIKMLREDNIKEIALDVETRNMNALNLYKSCGFMEQSIMNYYEIK